MVTCLKVKEKPDGGKEKETKKKELWPYKYSAHHTRVGVILAVQGLGFYELSPHSFLLLTRQFCFLGFHYHGLGCNIACFLASSSQKMVVFVVVLGCSKNSNIEVRGSHHDDYNAVSITVFSEALAKRSSKEKHCGNSSNSIANKSNGPASTTTTKNCSTCSDPDYQGLNKIHIFFIIFSIRTLPEENRCQRANRSAAVSWKIPMHVFSCVWIMWPSLFPSSANGASATDKQDRDNQMLRQAVGQ